MAFVPYLTAAAVSSSLRIAERFLPIQTNAERYLDREIDFRQATDDIVKHIRVYAAITSTKLVCDVIVLTMTGRWIYNILMHIRGVFRGLLHCGLEVFITGIQSSFDYVLLSVQSCSITMIVKQFSNFIQSQKNSFSFLGFCTICNQIYFLLIAATCDLTRTVQLELTKYWLECMGIIRAIAESLNIDFVKYMARSYHRQRINMDQSVDVPEIEWKRVKDPDFFRMVDVSLEELFHGVQKQVKVEREIRENGKIKPEIQEEIYTVTIEPGCPDGKQFRFDGAGNRDPVNIPADLVVQVRTSPHPRYERVGSDLIYKTTISLEDVCLFHIIVSNHFIYLGTTWYTTSSTIDRWTRDGIESVQYHGQQ